MRLAWLISFCALWLFGGGCLAPAAFALDFQDARHLLLRSGFGPERELTQTLLPLNRAEAVDLLLRQPVPELEIPACARVPAVPPGVLRKWSQDERRAYRTTQRQCRGQLKQWYVQQLLHSDAVLREQMTLFWHNHFTSSLRKVRDPQLIANQHGLLYRGALGRFDELLLAVVRDPAMLFYLDNVNNRKANPNENLARELLELFTLGEGHYGEQDVRAAARALTGLSVDPESRETRFYRKRHDDGDKTVFGTRGRYGPDQLVDLILQQPETANYITRSIWLHFVSEPDEDAIRLLADAFARDWDLAELVRGILTSDRFWRDQGRMIKSPVELVVGTQRLFGARAASRRGLPGPLRRMGQDLFDPPNVKGWPVEDWIGPSRLLVRIATAERLVRGFGNEAAAPQRSYLCDEYRPFDFAAVPPVTESATGGDCQQRVEALVADPGWQLK